MVLFRHSGLECFLSRIGWAGVDLFFVLSGFLVSTLLIKEFKKRESVDVVRFLIRRGFKIYPAFYFFLFATIIYSAFLTHQWPAKQNILAEVFFVQNYFPSIYYHTWSLAVEEHFYFLLAIIFFVAVKFAFLNKRTVMLLIIIAAILIVTGLRVKFIIANYGCDFIALFPTHYRIDGLFVGFLVSYLVQYYSSVVEKIMKYQWCFLIVGMLLISPLFFFTGGGRVMNLVGTNTMQLGFGLLLLISISNTFTFNTPKVFSWMYSFFCFIGFYSYSIYLWHLFVLDRIANHVGHGWLFALVYLSAAILTGIISTLIIEKPFLLLRDRLFPKREGSNING